jgi:hypothetical protein
VQHPARYRGPPRPVGLSRCPPDGGGTAARHCRYRVPGLGPFRPNIGNDRSGDTAVCTLMIDLVGIFVIVRETPEASFRPTCTTGLSAPLTQSLYLKKGKFPIWVILGGVIFQCGSWIPNYSNLGRFSYIRRLHCLTIPIWPLLRPQLLNALHTAYRTTLSMDSHSICSTGTSYYGCVRYGNDTVSYRTGTT